MSTEEMFATYFVGFNIDQHGGSSRAHNVWAFDPLIPV